jgi:hypothetical protein
MQPITLMPTQTITILTEAQIKAQADRMLKAKAIFNDQKVQDRISELYCRWQDEREYEDLAEYAKALEPLFAAHGAKVVQGSRRPFGIIVELDGANYLYAATSNSLYYKRVHPKGRP